MPLGSKTVARRLETALEAGSRVKDYAETIAATLLADLAPHYVVGKEPPDVRYLLELIGRRFASLSETLSTADYDRQNQASLTKFQKDRERMAAQDVRNLLADVRYVLDRTIGKDMTTLHFEGRSALVKMGFPVMVRVAGKLVTLMRDESVGWSNYPVDDHLTPRDVLAAKLEEALGQLRGTLEAGRPDRSALSQASNNWKRERDAKNLRLARRIRLVQAFFVDSGLELEAAALYSKARKPAALPEEGGGKGNKSGSGKPSAAAGAAMPEVKDMAVVMPSPWPPLPAADSPN
jgi:hypothetical protein